MVDVAVATHGVEPEVVFSVRLEPDRSLAGYDVLDPYVERFWLPVLGPSSVLLARKLYRDLTFRPPGSAGSADYSLTYDEAGFADLARCLGIKPRMLHRSLDRLVSFSVLGPPTSPGGPHLLPRKWPPLRAGAVARLPDSLRAEHGWWVQ
jgi:hypothetical protein